MRRPYHVMVIWPDDSGVRDPSVGELERARLAETVDALAKIPKELLSALPTDSRDWVDVALGDPQLDCIEEDVVRMVLRSDVAEARAICRRHLLSDDAGLSDDWIVAYLTECVTGSFAPRVLTEDYHALAVRVLPDLIREAGR